MSSKLPITWKTVQLKPISNKYDVWTLGAITKDGKLVLIDRFLPKFIKIDRKLVNVWYFICIHECIEFEKLQLGFSYDDSHKYATEQENDALVAHGIDPNVYNRELAKYIDKAWMRQGKKLHRDMHLKQVEDYPDIVEKLRKLEPKS